MKPSIILHGTDTIYGTEEDDTKHLLLGVLTTNHYHGCVCKWFKDNNFVGSGQNNCLLWTNEEGKYWVEISTLYQIINKTRFPFLNRRKQPSHDQISYE